MPESQYRMYLQEVSKLLEAAGDLETATWILRNIVDQTPHEWRLSLDLLLKDVLMRSD